MKSERWFGIISRGVCAFDDTSAPTATPAPHLLKYQISPHLLLFPFHSRLFQTLLRTPPSVTLDQVSFDMAGSSSRGRPPPMSLASRPTSTSRRSTPLASLKRLANSQEGQRKRPRPEQPPSRLRDRGEPAQPALSAERLDAEIRADEAADEALNHIIMAIDIRDRDTVGCAYYVAREQSLRCMEDMANGGIELLDICQFLPV
jgi:hypothetical protein